LPGAEHRDRRSLRDLVAKLHQKTLDDTFAARRDFHRGLVAFHRDQRLIDLHRIAGLHKEFDDGHLGKVADVRNPDLHCCHQVLSVDQA